MNPGLTIFLLLVAAGALAFLYFRVIQPFRELREVLRRLAAKDFRPVLLKSRHGMFHNTITEVRKISELLQHYERQVTDEGFSLRAILSSMVEGVLITDRAGRVRLVNEPLQRMFGLKNSPINRTVMEVFRHHELQNAIEQVLRDGESRQVEMAMQTSSGGRYATRHFEIHAGGLNPRPHALPLGAVVVFHDISDVKELEAVRREFVANVSHEFRTPLAIINGYVETLLDGAIDDRPMAEKFLNVMQKNGQRLNLLIEDLMTISRLEHRARQLDLQPVNLREILERVLERLEPAIAERQGKIHLRWDDSAARTRADGPRIEQVFANLVENALRHGQEGVVIDIEGRRHPGEIEIIFSDNGPGIPFDDQPHIFERFYRVHKDRSRAAGGTGLGLSIVKHIAQAHGGSVALESVPGRGAAFKVRLPATEVVAPVLV